MRRINYLFLALFATLAFAACSDDDEKEPEMAFCTVDQDPTEDKCKPFCDNPANAEHEKCKEAGFTTPDPAIDLCKGQETEYAAIEGEIVSIATNAALGCGATNVDTEDPDEVAELNACVSLGIAAAEGVEITAECAYCTARVVACAAANCLSQCAGSDTEACDTCRAENECEKGMAECQGFTEGEVTYCGEGQTPEADDCVVDCEQNDTHDSCGAEVVYCGEGQTPEADDCVVDCEQNDTHESCRV